MDEKRPVMALGLSDGRCPVGEVVERSDGVVTLALYSWLSGHFGVGELTVRERDVVETVTARELGDDEKVAEGYGAFQLVWAMDPLAAFQTAWKQALGEGLSDER
jgi:hypothetical protein